MKNYRALSDLEIEVLEKNSCKCDDWSLIKVKSDFNSENIKNVSFSGDIFLGVFNKSFLVANEKPRKSGIYNSTIHNCIIEDDVYINGIGVQIANYIINKKTIIENIGSLVATRNSTFGNGVNAQVLNEDGGREVPIYNELSSHTAYFLTFYRHKPKFIENIKQIIEKYSEERKNHLGYIGESVHLTNCQDIKDVCFGDYSVVSGATKLNNGTINSCKLAPTIVGSGVIAENFIIQEGASVIDNSIVTNSLIGQSVKIGKQYSIDNSLFFANSQGFHGEACSVFAGPFTATHHKSTLLIAGYYSFFNAGSGSNQSNHLYKLGPIHQGILARGSKTASESYILWPAKIGAFSLVIGKHYSNPDTSYFPYSYIVEDGGKSIVIPGIGLRSVGTIRDARKWPQRDDRKMERVYDKIIFDLLNPYSIQKMIKGLSLLKDNSEKDILFDGFSIKKSSIPRGIKFYNLALKKFLLTGLVEKLYATIYEDVLQLKSVLKPSVYINSEEVWVDLSGLIVPQSLVNMFVDNIEKGESVDLDKVYSHWHSSYSEMVWSWSVNKIAELYNVDVQEASITELMSLVHSWKEAVVELDMFIYEDAKKEFAQTSKTGFGIDGDVNIKELDFENVRGSFDSHPDIVSILDHIAEKERVASYIIEKLEGLAS